MKEAKVVTIFPVILLIFLLFAGICLSPVSGLTIPTISDLPAKNVSVHNISMAYREFGSGEPLIMIMGFSGAMDMWDPVILKNLSEHYHVIIFDNRGIGYSSGADTRFSIPLFANDTTGLMDALNISRAHILGWSMGSYVALQFATDYPDRVDHLILYAADPGTGKEIPASPEVVEQLNNMTGTPRERGERFLSVILPSAWMTDHPNPRTYFPNISEPLNTSALSGQIQAIVDWKGVYDQLDTIVAPTLLITGTEDRVIPPENSDIIAARIPGAMVEKIEGGGHGVMYQYPEKFFHIVLNFLTR